MNLMIIIIAIIVAIIFICYIALLDIDTTEETKLKPIEKRYIYTILGREPPSNSVVFRLVESDAKLTYQQIKDKIPSVEILSINVLDTKTGKF